MSDVRKPLKSFNWASWSIAEWENPTNDGKTFKSFTLSKSVYNPQTKATEKAGSVGINRKEDFSIILHIMEKAREKLQEQTLMNYGIRFNAEGEKIKEKFLVKFYKDKDGKDQTQQIMFDWLDLVYLRTLIRVFEDKMVYVNFGNKSGNSWNGSSNGNYSEEGEGEFITEKDGLDDDIPF